MLVTLPMSQAATDWLKADADWNMPYMLVTLDVSKLSGWLKADADWNMKFMFVTLDVSKLSGWLKADAPLNIA